MLLIVGVLLLVSGLIALRLSVPKNSRPRWFVNTQFEIPIVLMTIGAVGGGLLLTVMGVAEVST